MRSNHIKSKAIMNKYYAMYKKAIKNREEPGIILRISEEVDVCPCLVAKVLLQKHYSSLEDGQRSPSLPNVNKYLKDTTLIEDMDLAYEVYLVSRVVKFI